MGSHPFETSVQTGTVGSAWYSSMGDFNFQLSPLSFFPFQVDDLLNYPQFCALVLVCRGLSWFVAKWLDRCKSIVSLSEGVNQIVWVSV